MKLKKSDVNILLIVLGIGAALLTYFLVFTKLNDKTDTLKIQNASLQQEVDRLQDLANNKQKYLYLHRIIATAFIDNPDEKPQVNHIDENKLNNDLSNLEWCTERENAIHGTRTKRIAEKNFKKVIQLDLNDNILNVFKSMKQAEQETGIDASSISRCCNGKRKSAGRFKWRRNERI